MPIQAERRVWLCGSLAGHYNDIWKFNIDATNWTQISPQRTPYYTPFQSTIPPYQVFPAWPGGRSNPLFTYAPETKMFYMFGGINYNAAPHFADWWQLNTSSWVWTWLGGIQGTSNQNSFSGTFNQSTPGAYAGPRGFGAMWFQNGKIYMFGGGGYTELGAQGHLNDMWTLDPTVFNSSVWIGGSKQSDAADTGGVVGDTSPTNWPGALGHVTVIHKPERGEVWLFGGSKAGFGSQAVLLRSSTRSTL